MGDGEKAPLRLQIPPPGISRLNHHLRRPVFLLTLGLKSLRTLQHRTQYPSPPGSAAKTVDLPLAGYDDTNDAVRLSQDPARVIVGWQGSERKGASTSEWAGSAEFLTQEDNLKGLARINTQWVERAMAHTPHRE